MRTPRFISLAALGVGVAVGSARAQAGAPEPLPHQQFGVLFGLGPVFVNATEDYYLPNDGVKFGVETSLNYTYYFSKVPDYGLRIGLASVGRMGRFTFGAQEMRRAESFLAVPLELVTRHRWQQHPDWLSTMAVGGYFSELAQRQTYSLDPATGKTQRADANWVYGIGGITVSYGIAHRTGRIYRELGVRASVDLTGFTRSPGAADLPNLRCSNVTLYYALGQGFK